MRIVVTGTRGQVVSALREVASSGRHEIVSLGRPELDLAAPITVLPALQRAKPDLVISAAAYTNVDEAEEQPSLAWTINALGAAAVAVAAKVVGVPIIHLSTDYVFDGQKAGPYLETDATTPVNLYGASKLLGERFVATANEDHVILRTSWIYSPFGANFLKTMLRLSKARDCVQVVDDQHGCPTSAFDLATALLFIAQRLHDDRSFELRGIFHLPPAGRTTWADFAKAIFDRAAAKGWKACRVTPIATAEYPTRAQRPANSLLSGSKVKRVYGIELPAWRESLPLCVDRLVAEDGIEAPGR